MMNANVNKTVYLLVYILTITPVYFLTWLKLWMLEFMFETYYGSKLILPFVLYGLLLISISCVIFLDKWKKRKSLLIVRVTTFVCVLNVMLPSLLFFDGIIYTFKFIPAIFLLAILDCIYYFFGKKMID